MSQMFRKPSPILSKRVPTKFDSITRLLNETGMDGFDSKIACTFGFSTEEPNFAYWLNSHFVPQIFLPDSYLNAWNFVYNYSLSCRN